MHQVTGFYFHGKHVMYSTLYKSGRYASLHDRTGLTDQQAMGKFLIEHSHEVDHLMQEEKKQQQSKHLLNLIKDGN